MDSGIDSTKPLSILSTEFSLAGNTLDCSCHRNPSVFWLLLAWKIFLIWQITFKLELRILFIEASLPTLLFQFPLLSPLRSAALVCWKYFLVHCSEKCQGQLNYNWLHSQHNSGQYYSSMEKHKYSSCCGEWGRSDNVDTDQVRRLGQLTLTTDLTSYSLQLHSSTWEEDKIFISFSLFFTRRKFQNMLLGVKFYHLKSFNA